MRQSPSDETKRMIDSKIFELQSSLLEEGVTEALLRECTVWFRPKHLEDIIIERSEAEGMCGWPGCRNLLPSWGLRARRVFNMLDEEVAGRFCTRACMARTKVYLSAIPSASPYSRENVLRVACPSLVEKLAESTTNGAEAKTTFKRARRRDIPPVTPKPANSADGSIHANATGAAADEKLRADESMPACENKAPAHKTTSQAPSTDPGKDPASCKETGSESPDGGSGQSKGKSGEGSIAEGDGVVDSIRDALGRVSIAASISEKSSSSVSVPTQPLLRSPVPAGPTTTLEESSPAVEAAAKAARPGADPSTAGWSDWGNMRLSSQCSTGSTVSLHASLAAAAAGATVTDRASSAAAAAAAAAAVPVDSLLLPGPTPWMQSEARSGTNKESTTEMARRDVAEKASSQRPCSSKKGVSFAEGTKASRPDTIALAPIHDKNGGCSSPGVVGGAARGVPRRWRGGDGARGGRTAGRVANSKTAPQQRAVLGAVMEKPPVVPAPMMQQPAAGDDAAGGRAGPGNRDGAGSIEGHLPRVQADLSFRVMPRGYKVAKEDDVRIATDLAEAGTSGVEEEEIEENENESEASGETDGEDDDENDRAIWRETFGEEMPVGVAEGSWIDMDAIRDNAMREEFASSIGTFPLLWDALSEWVTPATRAVCRAGRAAVAATVQSGKQSDSVDTTTEATEESTPRDTGDGNFQARRAGAVAEAVEAEARRHARCGRGGGGVRSDRRDGGEDVGVTVTGALRHSGVSAMVNMHLAHAERALRAAAGGGGAYREGHSRTFVWSDKKASPEVKLLAARYGQWVEAGTLRTGASLAPGSRLETAAQPRQSETSADDDITAPGSKQRGADSSLAIGDSELVEGGRKVVRRGGGGMEAGERGNGGGPEIRRAVATVLDTFDAARAAGAANLSIAQWKVLPLIILTALRLGGNCCPSADGVLTLQVEEKAAGTDACLIMCGAEVAFSDREFEMLVELLLDD